MHTIETGDCRKSSPGRRDHARKGAEAGVWLLHLRNSKEAARPRTQHKRKRMGMGEDLREEKGIRETPSVAGAEGQVIVKIGFPWLSGKPPEGNSQENHQKVIARRAIKPRLITGSFVL